MFISEQQIIKYYEYFYQKISGSKKFTLKLTAQNNSLIKNFIEIIPETAGEDWLFDFFNYQFFRYADKETRFGKGKVMLSWVIGKNALQEYRERTEQQIYLAGEFKKKYNISPLKKQETKKVETKDYIYNLTKVKNFALCINSMFDIKEIFSSINCMGCEGYEYCKTNKLC